MTVSRARTRAGDQVATGDPARSRPVRGVSAAVAGGLVLMALAGVLVAWRGEGLYAQLGLGVPAGVVRYATPLVRTVTDLAGALCVGALAAGCFVVASGRGGQLGAHAYMVVRGAGVLAAAWAAGSLVLMVLTVANGTASGLGVLAHQGFGAAVTTLEEPAAWLVSAVAAAAAALTARAALSWRAAVAGCGLAVFALLPPVVTGRVASIGGDHDFVTDATVLSTVAVAVWLGAAAAVAAHLRRRGPQRLLVLRRLGVLAAAAAATAMVAGVVQYRWLLAGGLVSASYGWGVVAVVVSAAVAVVALAVLVRAARAGGDRVVRRALGVQIGALSMLVAVTAVLASDVPPALLNASSTQQTLLGFDLPGPPTVLGLLELWGSGRVNVLFDLAAALLAGGYLLAVRRLRRRGDLWPAGRTVAWLGGCGLLVWSTSSGLGRYAMAMFSAHMGLHMLLSMLVPVLLVLGGPVSLALRALPAAGPDGADGPREWIVALTASPAARLLTHPLVALVLFVGSFYALYFSGIYAAAMPYHWAHQAMNIHFVVVGYLFFWPIIGVDHAPTSLPHVGRLGLLLASMPFHAFFGIALLSADEVIGAPFFGGLALPWVPDLLADQSVGGGIAWASGELPLLVVVIALLVQWSRHDERAAARHDRQADRDGDAELEAWNQMLADISRPRR